MKSAAACRSVRSSSSVISCDELRALLNCSQALTRHSQSLTALLGQVARQLRILLPESSGYVIHRQGRTQRIRAFGKRHALRKGDLQALLTTSGKKHHGVLPLKAVWKDGRSRPDASVLVIPLGHSSNRLGFIVSDFLAPERRESARKVIQAVGDLAEAHLLNARARETIARKARYLAEHDNLVTKLANRRLFRQRVRKTLQIGPAAVIFLDMDDFKSVNRKFGYSAGDEVLKTIADRWRRTVKKCCPHATLARMGGDEFTVLVPAAERARAETLAESLIAELRTAPKNAGAPPVPRASAGVSQSFVKGARVDDVLRRAEVAMYRAKAAGGDRYALARQEPPGVKGRNVNA